MLLLLYFPPPELGKFPNIVPHKCHLPHGLSPAIPPRTPSTADILHKDKQYVIRVPTHRNESDSQLHHWDQPEIALGTFFFFYQKGIQLKSTPGYHYP